MPKSYRVGIIGCGVISSAHLSALKGVPGATVVAVCDARRETAATLAGKHDIEQVYTDFRRMLATAKLDVVHILTPPQSHLELATRCLEAGVHVYVEKPAVLRVSDGEALRAAAMKGGTQLCAGHDRLYHPVVVKACQAFDAGVIGDLLRVRVEQGWTRERRAHSLAIPWSYRYEWGVVDNLLPHSLYLLHRFMPHATLEKSIGKSRGLVPESIVDDLHLTYADGDSIGHVDLTMRSKYRAPRVLLEGTKGDLVADFGSMTTVVNHKGKIPDKIQKLLRPCTEASQLTRGALGNFVAIATKRLRSYAGIHRILPEFYASLASGAKTPADFDAAIWVAGALETLKRDVVSSQTEKLPEPLIRAGAESPRPVLVTGAGGFLGSRLVERFSRSGQPVVAMTRLLSRSKPLPFVEWRECDLTNIHSVRALVKGTQAVFHCAGLVGPPGSLSDYRRVNVKGSLAVLHAARLEGIAKVVHVSSVGVYGVPKTSTPWVSEESAYDDKAHWRGHYTITKMESDRAVIRYGKRIEEMSVVVIRPGTIYGPGSPLPVGRLRVGSFGTRPVIIGGLDASMPLCHVENVVDAMLSAAEISTPGVSVYNIVDDPELDQEEVGRLLSEISDGRMRPLSVPYTVAWLGFTCLDMVKSILTSTRSRMRYRMNRALATMWITSASAMKDLGWQPKISIRDGLAEVYSADIAPSAPAGDVVEDIVPTAAAGGVAK